jgi:acyl-CoA reductase-like NAD-dependent aldehyde dehydrogenase
LLINGKETITGQRLEVRNPYDDTIVGTTYQAGEAELESAIAAAQRCQREMAELPSHVKEAALRHIAQQLEERTTELALLLARESAKPLKYALIELARSVQTFRIAAEECKRCRQRSFNWTGRLRARAAKDW